MKLVFWQSILSPHQASYIRVLAGFPGWSVTVVAGAGMTPDRTAMGWQVPDLGNARAIISPSYVADLIDELGSDRIHILEGIRGCPLVRTALPILIRRSRRMGIVSETGDSGGKAAGVRRFVYRCWALRNRGSVDFILAIGSSGVDWYRHCYFPETTIYPFLYTTEAIPAQDRTLTTTDEAPLNIFFIARCLDWKGGATLLQALDGIAGGWRLTVIGDGPALPAWKSLASDLDLDRSCMWLGALPNNVAMEKLERADLLVMPSTGVEGWGAVVNEALMRGIPVLCSDCCGAADLLREPWRGEIFKAGSPDSLRDALRNWISRGKRTAQQTQRIKAWARCIEGEQAANYLAAVLRHVYQEGPRPCASWLAGTPSAA